jgi:membrane protease subunit (stomatin/prohibitin family)
MPFRNVISTLLSNGEEVMGPDIMLWHYPNNDIMNQSLLTVESNHFCVLKSRGAILNVYETGQYPIDTPQKVLFGGQSPWQFEALYINRSKLVIKTSGRALSRELAEMSYDVDYYVHVATKEDAVKLVQHMPYRGHALSTEDVNVYAGPVVEQAVNQVVQVTPLERVNEKIHELTEIVHEHLQEFLAAYGVTLDMVKVLVSPADELMRQLIALKAFGLTEIDAVRYYTALEMARRGVISAPNMAVGLGFNIGAAMSNLQIPMSGSAEAPTRSVSVPRGDN